MRITGRGFDGNHLAGQTFAFFPGDNQRLCRSGYFVECVRDRNSCFGDDRACEQIAALLNELRGLQQNAVAFIRLELYRFKGMASSRNCGIDLLFRRTLDSTSDSAGKLVEDRRAVRSLAPGSGDKHGPRLLN